MPIFRLNGLKRAQTSVLALAVTVASLLAPHAVSAETLMDALASTYATNAQLDAERARLRATDEGVSQAEGQFRPTITGNAQTGYQFQQSNPSQNSNGTNHPKSLGVTFTQPLFRGFRTINGINVAEAQVRAGREVLRNTEQTVLLAAITAFMDVVRDQAILKLRENNQKVLADTLRSTQDQFKVGEVTRTDVAQAEASLAAAVSAIELARANLKSSRATYERYIGHPPSNLVEAKPLGKVLPLSLDAAIGIATQETPAVVSALYNEQAARFNIDLIRGELLPTVSVQGSFTDSYPDSKNNGSALGNALGISTGQPNETRTTTVTGQLTVPIYEQGIVYSRVRAAKHTQLAAIQEIQRARTESQAAIVAAWSQHKAARAQLASDQSAVEANRVALTGVREEEKVGQRTKLDVLNAEQAYLNAQVNLVTTRHNVVVNDYTVMQAIGRLNVQELAASGQVYDVEEHYFEVRRKWWGLDITHADGRHERMDTWRTVGEQHESMK
jgi:outer membrane protein